MEQRLRHTPDSATETNANTVGMGLGPTPCELVSDSLPFPNSLPPVKTKYSLGPDETGSASPQQRTTGSADGRGSEDSFLVGSAVPPLPTAVASSNSRGGDGKVSFVT